MPKSNQITDKQRKFRDAWLRTGDATLAYKEAGYKAEHRSALSRMMNLPFMLEARTLLEEGTRAGVVAMAKRTVEAAALVTQQPVRALEARQGRLNWLMDIMEGNATIEQMQLAPDGEGGMSPVELKVVPDFKERLLAAKLLGMMHADFVVKKEETIKKETVTKTFVHVDNGRGPLPTGTKVHMISESVTWDTCLECGEPFDSSKGHECPTEKQEKALTSGQDEE